MSNLCHQFAGWGAGEGGFCRAVPEPLFSLLLIKPLFLPVTLKSLIAIMFQCHATTAPRCLMVYLFECWLSATSQ
eukprot:COSAG01_NODE_7210_length_3304_cov_2.853354_1_plen_75_part_00